jgi:hypothetical protein
MGTEVSESESETKELNPEIGEVSGTGPGEKHGNRRSH